MHGSGESGSLGFVEPMSVNLMCLEVRGCGEALGTHTTYIGSLPCVSPQVFTQVSLVVGAVWTQLKSNKKHN